MALLLSQHWWDVISECDFCGQTSQKALMFNVLSIKACCYARSDAVALCGLVGIAKIGQKYQKKV